MKKTERNGLLILTIGAGTSGKHSDIASGMRRTIELMKPRKCFLMPSVSEDSKTVAELVAESADGKICEMLPPFTNPEDMETCRREFRAALGKAKGGLRQGETLFINPTSGTKQMGIAAALAALDEGIGSLVFTGGRRTDGVVETGSERLVSFDPADCFLERDRKLALRFAKEGDFFAAATVLENEKERNRRAAALAWICFHWQRFDYEKAAGAAAGCDATLKKRFDGCFESAKRNRPDPRILADILAWAEFALNRSDAETATRLAYKALEAAGRLALAEKASVFPDESNGLYDVEAIQWMDIPKELKTKIQNASSDGVRVALGLAQTMRILDALKHPLGKEYCNNRRLKDLAEARNANTHSIKPVGLDEAKQFLRLCRETLERTLPAIELPGAAALPDLSAEIESLLNKKEDA